MDDPVAPRTATSGTWYLAQSADGAWRMFSRSQTDTIALRTLVELAGYPAVVTPGGNLFHLGSSLRRMAAMREH
jgi:hypothetical protein